MTPQEKLNVIREKCIEANPSIMQIETSDIGYTHQSKYARDIRIADIFLALRRPKGTLKKLGEYYETRDNLLGIKDSTESGLTYYIVCNWKLSQDDIDEQSPETIEFIYSLLI